MHEAYACWCYWSFGKKEKKQKSPFFSLAQRLILIYAASSFAPFAFYGRYHFHWLVSRLSPANFLCLAKSSNWRLVLIGFRRHCTVDVRTILCPIHFLFPSQLVLSISLVIDVFLTAEAEVTANFVEFVVSDRTSSKSSVRKKEQREEQNG